MRVFTGRERALLFGFVFLIVFVGSLALLLPPLLLSGMPLLECHASSAELWALAVTLNEG
jgi:hypothetical protein